MIDAKACIALPRARLIVPEGPNAAARMAGAQGIGPPLCHQRAEGGAALGLHQRIARHCGDGEGVIVVGNDIIVAREHRRPLLSEQLKRPRAQPVDPAQLVIKFRPRLRIAVGEIDGRDHQSVDLGLDIAAVVVLGLAAQPLLPLDRGAAARKDRHAIETLLPVPDRAIARRFDVADRQRVVGRLQLLQANDIGLLLGQIFDQTRQPRLDAVDVEADDFHAVALIRPRSWSRSRSPTLPADSPPGTPCRRAFRRNRPPRRAPDQG